MKQSSIVGSTIKLVVVLGCTYALAKYGYLDQNQSSGELSEYAEQACVDTIKGRFDTVSVNTYAVEENSSGYTIKVSVGLARGTKMKIVCLANEQGGIREITIQE
jgi:hypothetical protein